MRNNSRNLFINLFLILTCTFFTACPALADSIASNTAGPRISRYTNFNLSNPDNIFTYDFWPGAVSPANVWWIPLEFNTQQDDAIQAIIKPITYPDGWQGYEIAIGTESEKIISNQFDLAQAVGRLSYKPKDRSSGYCTATHVGNGYVVTAGHCLDNPKIFPDTCSALRVEWNYRRSRTDFPQIPESNLIGQCQEIVSWSFTVGDAEIIDHAIFRVDLFPEAKVAIEPRPVLKVGDRLHQFSHPGAAPLIMSKSCTITDLPFQYFQHNCWGASGSSGAALIDASTNKLIGVLSMGSNETFFTVRNDQSPIGRFDPASGKLD